MNKEEKIKGIIDAYGQPFYEEVGIRDLKTPTHLFQWLFTSNLFSTRISSNISVRAAKGLIKEGYTSPKKVKQSTWNERVKVLNKNGYARYQERTSTFLGDLSDRLLEKYNGDLRKIREEAAGDRRKALSLVGQFKGIGRAGAGIFLREAQLEWEEFFPYMDQKSKRAASRLKLPVHAEDLAKGLDKTQFIKLLAALVRIDLNKDYKLEKLQDQGAQNKEEKKPEKKIADKLLNKDKGTLYELAKRKNIKGRSKMNKEQLAAALAK